MTEIIHLASTVALWLGILLSGTCGFYFDMIARDRARATYHIAWFGVFLAMLALRGLP